MGWYLRKSISFGGFRLNFSKSGIGFSSGIKGLRFGIGPKGSYIHAGRHGFYYKQSLGKNFNSYDVLAETTAYINDIEKFTDKESKTTIQQIKDNRRKFIFFPLAFLLCFIPVIGIWIAPFIAILLYLLFDRKIKKTVLLYDLQNGCDWDEALKEFTECAESWYLIDDGDALLQKQTKIFLAPPKNIETNILVLQIKIDKTRLYFFPDRLLIYDGNQVCGINYKNMCFDQDNNVLAQCEEVPIDAVIVDNTWLHTRQDGLPDQRYSYNPSLPKLNYSEITFSSNTGLPEQKIMFSQPDIGKRLVNIINASFGQPKSETQKEVDMFYDEKKLDNAKEIIKRENYINISFLQRHLELGYNQTAKIIDILLARGELKPDNSGNYLVVNGKDTLKTTNNVDYAGANFDDYNTIEPEDLADIQQLIRKYMCPSDDDTMRRALEIVVLDRNTSAGHLQRRLRISYNHAAELLDQMEERGILGPPSGSENGRDILIFDGCDIS